MKASELGNLISDAIEEFGDLPIGAEDTSAAENNPSMGLVIIAVDENDDETYDRLKADRLLIVADEPDPDDE